ncbi:MAG TPA: hypothetical protein PKC76_10270 [Saprospiraceae bacterium]|nr:hypothetical protein [Saprospiraceae bacterium]HMP24508.1 hypothetical protein [Saprospiraceae bacterium]
MNRIIKSILAIVVCTFITPEIYAGGWPQPRNGGFLKMDISAIYARRFYGMDGNIYNINGAGTRLSNYVTAFYGEYGLTDRLTVIGYVPFLVRNTVNEGIGALSGEVLQPGLENTSIGDIDLGLRYGLFARNGWSVTTSLLLGLPTGDATNANLLFTGDGEFNQLIRIEAGYGTAQWYATGFIGFNNRTRNFSDEWRFELEFGHKFFNERLLAGVKLAGTQSLRNGDPTGSGNGLFSNNVEFISPQAFLAYEFKNQVGIQAQVAGAMSGRNVLAAPANSFGVYFRW